MLDLIVKLDEQKQLELAQHLTGMRLTVLWFALQMEKQLRKNDHKGGWENEPTIHLLHRLEEEFVELGDATEENGADAETVVAEAADVANFAMFIADNKRCGRF